MLKTCLAAGASTQTQSAEEGFILPDSSFLRNDWSLSGQRREAAAREKRRGEKKTLKRRNDPC
jgi:hypothetical protein